MNKKGFANIILVAAIVILLGAVGYFTFVRKSPEVVRQTTNKPVITNQDKIIATIEINHEKYNFYSKNNNVYFESDLLKDVDLDSFKIVGIHASSGYLIKDNKFVYLISFKVQLYDQFPWTIEKVENLERISNILDVKNFNLTKNNFFGKDYKNVYAMVQKDRGGPAIILKELDPKSFTLFDVLNGEYVKDNAMVIHYYYSLDFVQDNVKEADAASFEDLGYGYAKDKSLVFYEGKVLVGADTGTFEIFDGNWAKDKNNEYFNGRIMNK